jgi:serine protease Do
MTSEEASENIRRIAEEIGPAVVGLGRGWGRGSGVVVADGLVLTIRPGMPGRGPRGRRGHHRDLGPDDAVPVVMADGRVVDGRFAGSDPLSPLAVVAVETTGITPIAPAEAAAPGIGAAIIALGNPGGRGLRVTSGFVSAEPRSMPTHRIGGDVVGIEHTAPLPHGSSGGPLVDASGHLLGVHVLRPAPGLIISLATGADVVERAQAIAAGTIARPRELGVAVAPPQVARRMRRAVGLPEVTGVLVREVVEGSTAARAGVLSGDLLTAVAGHPVDSIRGLAAAIATATAGQEFDIAVVRGSQTLGLRGVFPDDTP